MDCVNKGVKKMKYSQVALQVNQKVSINLVEINSRKTTGSPDGI